MELVKDMSKEILAGNISLPHPLAINKKLQCSYCEYSCLCKFDTLFEGNTHKTVKALKGQGSKRIINEKGGKLDGMDRCSAKCNRQ